MIERLLRLAAHDNDAVIWCLGRTVRKEDGSGWRVVDEDQVFFAVFCNDVFVWGSADAEDIDFSGTDLDDLEQALNDAEAAGHRRDGFLLWVARKRGMRPQGAMYKYLHEGTWPLFNAAGPKREVGIGNPRPIPHE